MSELVLIHTHSPVVHCLSILHFVRVKSITDCLKLDVYCACV